MLVILGLEVDNEPSLKILLLYPAHLAHFAPPRRFRSVGANAVDRVTSPTYIDQFASYVITKVNKLLTIKLVALVVIAPAVSAGARNTMVTFSISFCATTVAANATFVGFGTKCHLRVCHETSPV